MDAIRCRGRSGKVVVVEKETIEINVQHTLIFVPNFMTGGGKEKENFGRRQRTNVRGCSKYSIMTSVITCGHVAI